jgi:hypothetical protein
MSRDMIVLAPCDDPKAVDEFLHASVAAHHQTVTLRTVGGLRRRLACAATTWLIEQRALGFRAARLAVELDVRP